MKKIYINPSVQVTVLRTRQMLATSGPQGIKTNNIRGFGGDAGDGDSGDARESLWGEEEW